MYNPFQKPTAHIAIEKYNNNGMQKREIANKSAHNFRLDNTQPLNPEKTCENQILVDAQRYPCQSIDGSPIYGEDGYQTQYDFYKQIEERIKEHNIKPRKGAVECCQIIMEVTGGFDKLPEGFDQDKWVSDSMKFLEETFGKDNIVSANLHVDEYTPHIHAMVTPITSDGRLCLRDWFHTYKDYQDIQTSYYEACKQDGIEKCKSNSKMPYESQRKAQEALCRAGEIEIEMERQPGETDKDYEKRVTKQVQLYSMDKELELQTEFRKFAEENARLVREKEEAELREEKAKKDAEIYKAQMDKEKAEKEFYAQQLTGSGLTRGQLKHTEEAISKLQAEHEAETRLLKNTNSVLRERVETLTEEKEQLEVKVASQEETIESYHNLIGENGLTEVDLKQLQTTKYMLAAIQAECPDHEHIKKCIMDAVKFGKSLKHKELQIEHEEDI